MGTIINDEIFQTAITLVMEKEQYHPSQVSKIVHKLDQQNSVKVRGKVTLSKELSVFDVKSHSLELYDVF